MAVGKGSIGRVSKAVEKQIPAVAVEKPVVEEMIEVVEEPVVEEVAPVKKTTRKPAAKKPAAKKPVAKKPVAKKPAVKKEVVKVEEPVVVKKDNCQVGDQMPMYLM